jgi:hypothetical protein
MGSVKLLWRPIGQPPASADFQGADAQPYGSGKDAIESAMRAYAGDADRAPWIRVGERVYSPDQIKALHEAKFEQDTGYDEAMPGDEPWE